MISSRNELNLKITFKFHSSSNVFIATFLAANAFQKLLTDERSLLRERTCRVFASVFRMVSPLISIFKRLLLVTSQKPLALASDFNFHDFVQPTSKALG